MRSDWLDKVRRGLRKPPRYIVSRMVHEFQAHAERHIAPRRLRQLTAAALARKSGYRSIALWWDALAARPYPAQFRMTPDDVERNCSGDQPLILQGAERALAHEVNLLGSGLVRLGPEIDWHRDYKTGYRWEPAYCRDIEYNNPDRPSDVKFPWELSRMQWMIPLGQAYILDADERYALAARDLIDSWIRANPYASSVNWSCTMEAALRILSWTWFFHVFKHSTSWSDPGFRERFLQALYFHGDFTARNLEKSDINGNHYTADAAGLVFAGLFFGNGEAAERWARLGWDILREEIPLQVLADGVDFEASVAYHRLVQELFFLPALYRRQLGFEVPGAYVERLLAMARFTAAYSRPDGSVPLWGDADDARALPLGSQALNDHRYLVGLVALTFGADDLLEEFSGPRSEILWLLGKEAAATLPDRAAPTGEHGSVAFTSGGFYVLRNRTDHVFVDCGPVGMGGRGGHGHNDLLSFEAVLDGVHLVSDCGAYLYTADFAERNRFRSTAYHNTPRVDDAEINRFIRWDYLWTLHNDATPEVREVSFTQNADRLVLSHSGYGRLESPVFPVRSFILDHEKHRLTILDAFEGAADHRIDVPLHLAAGVNVDLVENARVILRAGPRNFALTWNSPLTWELRVEPGRVSPSYGVAVSTMVLTWSRTGPLAPLAVTIEPMAAAATVPHPTRSTR